MRIVIAPDSFKESLTALEVAQAIKIGFQKILPHAEYVLVPMADGGEGTVQSLVDATQGEIINTEVIALRKSNPSIFWIIWRQTDRHYRNGGSIGLAFSACRTA